MLKMRLSLFWLACASMAAVVAMLAFIAVTAPRRDLDCFMREVGTVEVGKTKLEDWRHKVAEAQLAGLNFVCDQQNCGVGLQRENKLLHKLRIAPPTIVDASVGFKNGVADGIYIALIVGGRNGQGEWYDDKGVVVRLSSDQPNDCHPDYALRVKNRNQVGDRYWATVSMDSCVSPEARAKAVAINTACLTQIGGCKEVEEMIPKAFAHD